jgi:GNAT superfamily N-acetyltransferase
MGDPEGYWTMSTNYAYYDNFRKLLPMDRNIITAAIVEMVERLNFYVRYTHDIDEVGRLTFGTGVVTIGLPGLSMAHRLGVPAILGFLAEYPHDGGRWIQYAWTMPAARGKGVFRELVKGLAMRYDKCRIGLGTDFTNVAMRKAATAAGFGEGRLYYNLEPQVKKVTPV